MVVGVVVMKVLDFFVEFKREGVDVYVECLVSDEVFEFVYEDDDIGDEEKC